MAHMTDLAHYADTHGFERDNATQCLAVSGLRHQVFNKISPTSLPQGADCRGCHLAGRRGCQCRHRFFGCRTLDFVGQVETKSPVLRRSRGSDLDDMATRSSLRLKPLLSTVPVVTITNSIHLPGGIFWVARSSQGTNGMTAPYEAGLRPTKRKNNAYKELDDAQFELAHR